MPDPWGRFTSLDELAATFWHFGTRHCGDYAPLYARLGTGIASDRDLLSIAAHAPPGQSSPDLMLAAVHHLLSSNPAHPLARHYPTLTHEPTTSDPFPLFRSFCLEHRDQLEAVITSRRVQTNEFRRCCYLLPTVMLVSITHALAETRSHPPVVVHAGDPPTNSRA